MNFIDSTLCVCLLRSQWKIVRVHKSLSFNAFIYLTFLVWLPKRTENALISLSSQKDWVAFIESQNVVLRWIIHQSWTKLLANYHLFHTQILCRWMFTLILLTYAFGWSIVPFTIKFHFRLQLMNVVYYNGERDCFHLLSLFSCVCVRFFN